jgi:hypothetical protein
MRYVMFGGGVRHNPVNRKRPSGNMGRISPSPDMSGEVNIGCAAFLVRFDLLAQGAMTRGRLQR